MDIHSKALVKKDISINIPSNTSVKIMQLDSINANEFLSLKLANKEGSRIGGNFYWLSDKPDEFAWDKTTWAFTPMRSYADFTPLSKLPLSNIQISTKTEEKGSEMVIYTHLSNPTDKVAFFVTLTLNDEKGNSLFPVFWDDNYFSLLPGEKREISCSVPTKIISKTKPQLSLSGWNIKPQLIGIK
jgi:exo-1,4-beta-D-glucosaminidase